MERRDFIKKSAVAGIASPALMSGLYANNLFASSNGSPEETARDVASGPVVFWASEPVHPGEVSLLSDSDLAVSYHF